MHPASCQARPLTEFYSELAAPKNHESIVAGAHLMLELPPHLERACRNYDVWALTSHKDLVLLARDDYTSPWFVRIHPRTYAPAGYHVRYLMASGDAPWPHAIVGGSADSVKIAADMVATSLERCGGWPR
jgi:hypothetical protein